MRNRCKTPKPSHRLIFTMKTSRSATLIALLSLALLGTTARADYSSADSKHGAWQSHPRSSGVYINPEWSRHVWLCPGGADSGTTVTRIVVSLADQRLYAYSGPQLVAWSNVSSGRTGHDTPTGSFTVSQKDVDHHSSLYEDASMPYFMRLTDGGVGMHAGFLPGYPASHGCVRLPFDMARDLYRHVDAGTPVEIIDHPVAATVAETVAATSGVSVAQD
jgi:hypothetical protein